jgi:ADP-ribosylglycohydrolase
MRIAPIGLIDCQRAERLRQDVRTAGALTHSNPEALAGGLAVAHAVACLSTSKVKPPTLIEETVAFVGDCAVSRNLRCAQSLLNSGIPEAEALVTLGTTGYVVHTVASAFYCFVRTPDNLKKTIIDAVVAGHDTDTTGAVAGALSGAYNGEHAIPRHWREGIERGEYIKQLACKLYALVKSS